MSTIRIVETKSLHQRQNKTRRDMGAQETELADLEKTQSMSEDQPASETAGRKESGKVAMNRGGPRLLAVCFVGIFVSYFIYGLLQEKITKRKFGDERFHYFMFLVAMQCIINAMFARLVARTIYHSSGIELSLDPKGLFALLSFTYVGAMLASNTSLAFISYPTQVLGKSAKPIPVLIFGVLLSHKSYPLMKYFIVLLIVLGVALFLYSDEGQSSNDDNGDQWRLFHFLGIGELLVFISLAFDGITGAIQERLRAGNEVHALHMMYAVNVYSAVYLLAAMSLTGEVFEAAGFVQRHPTVLLNMLAFALMSAIGQIFIFTTITNFGPLTCSIFTTTRKFFTILGSVLIFGNSLLSRQWFGVVLVFIGLGLDISFGKASKSQPKPESSTNGNTSNAKV